MEFRILGPVQVYDGRSRAAAVPAGAKQRALLGALVVRAGRTVPAEQLVDELWGAYPPGNAANALQAHMTRLRRLLPAQPPAPGAGGAGREWVITRPLGYALRLDGAVSDAGQFRELAARGRALAAGDPRRAVGLLRAGLALWRGPALQGGGRGAICSAEALVLEENRLAALETLYEACLRAGLSHEITGELEELTAAHPLRERFYELSMTALQRCGRRAEALGTYERARRRLVHELGIEPGPVLRACREAVLHHPGPHPHPGPGPAGPESAQYTGHAPQEAPARAAHGPQPATAPAPGGAAGPAASTAAGTAAGAAAEGAAGVHALRAEMALLYRHVERLARAQQDLATRVERLLPGAGGA